MPQCRDGISIRGARPQTATRNSMGSLAPPVSRISVLKAVPVAALKMPSFSKKQTASADNFSDHLQL